MNPGPDYRACTSPSALEPLMAHPGLDMFRPAEAQLEALIGVAADPRSCVSVAQDGQSLVGYAAFHPPSAVETWSEDRSGQIIELGAVEVAPPWRGSGMAEKLLEISFATGRFEETVVFATMYVWHYDLKRTELSAFAYKRLLERLYRKAGLVPYPTADPEIRASGANQLMARIGPRTPDQVTAEFHRLRTRLRFD